MYELSTLGFIACAVMYLMLFLLLATSWRGRLQGILLVAACLVSALWASVNAYSLENQSLQPGIIALIEIIRDSAWLYFIISLSGGLGGHVLPKYLILVTNALWISLLTASAFLLIQDNGSYSGDVMVYGGMILALTGFILVEQLYRKTASEKRNAVKFLFLGLGAMFFYDIYLYSNAILLDEIDIELWSVRGAINSLIVPLIAVSASRNPDWSLKIFVSRQVVFYSTGILGIGVYLLAMAAGGYYVKTQDASWGGFAQTTFFFAALILLFAIMLSEQIRARVKLFLNKHFYHNKYDYREEWLHIIKTLSEDEVRLDLGERAIKAVCNIVDSKGGMIWLKGETNNYFHNASFNTDEVDYIESGNSNFIHYLENKKWVIDVIKAKNGDKQYSDLELPDWIGDIEKAWLIIPLMYHDGLMGFMILIYPNVMREINWEDRDLLKAASRQAASYLALRDASEKLERANQFEAFNRLSSYVVHDLKNMVGQLSLVVSNATKHKGNPDFMEDAIKTVENATVKMNKLLSQLKKGRFVSEKKKIVVLDEVLKDVIENRSGELPVPMLNIDESDIRVLCEPDRLRSVIEHLVQNAQEATEDSGKVNLVLRRNKDNAIIDVEDTGCGMDSDFIRKRLFRPFDTTKGNAGMGIGVYESKDFIVSEGGKLEVASKPGVGTTFTIMLPILSVQD